ncbi:hypothetical protein PV797_08790 [Clostridiaceae bacterium M8S5]|nr:hypothetical protein PV797_08790 [Clostridiaceae bacterium M8S5]
MKTKALVLILLVTFVVGVTVSSAVEITPLSGNSIVGEGLRVDYSEGYESKARVQFNRLGSMKSFYKEQKGLDLKINVELLDRNDWAREYNDVPYGLPFIMLYTTPIVVLPATQDGVVVELGLKNKDYVTSDLKKELSDIGYTFEEAVKLFPDLIGLHEVGHSLTFENGNTNLNSWFNEFMATYFAYAYLVNKEPKHANLWKVNAKITYLDGSKPKYTKLKDFDEIYSDMPVENYDWYQKQFTLLAERVYNSMGLNFIDKVKEVFKDDSVNSEQTFEKLRTISPIFDQWREEMSNKFK